MLPFECGLGGMVCFLPAAGRFDGTILCLLAVGVGLN